jgi:hypothetical protein
VIPTARRGLLISWGDRSAAVPILEAAALGWAEFSLRKPAWSPDWLPDAVDRDQWGFIVTGPDSGQHWQLQRAPFLFETTTPGVFAAGDVRHGSVKRVASAMGEGSIVIRLVQDYLALAPTMRRSVMNPSVTCGKRGFGTAR